MDDRMTGLLGMVRSMREHFDPLPPVALWRQVGGEHFNIAILPGDAHEGTIAEQCADLRRLAAPTEWFALVMDTYARDGGRDDAPPDMAALEEAFLAGDPAVVEQVVTILWPKEERPAMAWQVYRWTPVDGWEWDAPVTATPEQMLSSVVWL
jgi:hypothetical protein